MIKSLIYDYDLELLLVT